MGKADCQLTEEAASGKGFGGIGVPWHKSIAATPIGGTSLDHVCEIRQTVDDGDRSVMCIIDMYLPCLDQGMDLYSEQLSWRGC